MIVAAARRTARTASRLMVIATCVMVPLMASDRGDAQEPRQSSTFRLAAEAGRWNGAGLRDLPKGAHLAIEGQADGKTTLLLMDEAGMAAFPLAGVPLLASSDSERFEFSLTLPEPGDYFLVVDNREGSETRTAVINVTASAPGAMSGAEYLESANRMLALVNEALHRVFVLGDFDMRLEPCGETRAFAESDDIIVCTQYAMLLLTALPDPKAGSPVMMHTIFQRLAETLAAGRETELDVPEMDDLATALMVVLQYRDHVDTAASFFSDPDRAERFAALMPEETRYRLNAERARRIAAAADEPIPLLARWNDLLIASFQPAILERLLENTPTWTDRAAVEAELAARR